MRIAVISDIHANLEAFERVWDDIAKCAIDRVICLGDMIGYGPEPDAVVSRLHRLGIPSVMGNHELAVASPRYLQWFNPQARLSLTRTIEMLSEQNRERVCRLKRSLVAHGGRFVHGFPPHSQTLYLFQVKTSSIERALTTTTERICFVGHTHLLESVSLENGQIVRHPLREGNLGLAPNRSYIINAGSVGQPRDGNPKAKYIIWDQAAEMLEVRYVAYDIAVTADKIVAAGLPRAHANRLW